MSMTLDHYALLTQDQPETDSEDELLVPNPRLDHATARSSWETPPPEAWQSAARRVVKKAFIPQPRQPQQVEDDFSLSLSSTPRNAKRGKKSKAQNSAQKPPIGLPAGARAVRGGVPQHVPTPARRRGRPSTVEGQSPISLSPLALRRAQQKAQQKAKRRAGTPPCAHRANGPIGFQMEGKYYAHAPPTGWINQPVATAPEVGKKGREHSHALGKYGKKGGKSGSNHGWNKGQAVGKGREQPQYRPSGTVDFGGAGAVRREGPYLHAERHSPRHGVPIVPKKFKTAARRPWNADELPAGNRAVPERTERSHSIGTLVTGGKPAASAPQLLSEDSDVEIISVTSPGGRARAQFEEGLISNTERKRRQHWAKRKAASKETRRAMRGEVGPVNPEVARARQLQSSAARRVNEALEELHKAEQAALKYTRAATRGGPGANQGKGN